MLKLSALGSSAFLSIVIWSGAIAAEREPSSHEPSNVCDVVPGVLATSRELEWDGTDELGISVGGRAVYTPGSDGKVHITGDPQLLAHIRIREGNIELDCKNGKFDTAKLSIALPGREFKAFNIASTTRLELKNLFQDQLEFDVAGAATLRGTGIVRQLSINSASSGSIDLGTVAADTAKVNSSGSGRIVVAPHGQTHINIVGTGDVALRTKPSDLTYNVVGSGRVRSISQGE
jgi:hypothetical protein